MQLFDVSRETSKTILFHSYFLRNYFPGNNFGKNRFFEKSKFCKKKKSYISSLANLCHFSTVDSDISTFSDASSVGKFSTIDSFDWLSVISLVASLNFSTTEIEDTD